MDAGVGAYLGVRYIKFLNLGYEDSTKKDPKWGTGDEFQPTKY